MQHGTVAYTKKSQVGNVRPTCGKALKTKKRKVAISQTSMVAIAVISMRLRRIWRSTKFG